jgi:hypothetical protein
MAVEFRVQPLGCSWHALSVYSELSPLITDRLPNFLAGARCGKVPRQLISDLPEGINETYGY